MKKQKYVFKSTVRGATSYFSTRAKATEHLLNTLPLLNMNDIQEVVHMCEEHCTMDLLMIKLRERAKKEIKQK